MRVKDYSLNRCRRRRVRWAKGAVIALRFGLSDDIVLRAMSKARGERKNEVRLLVRTRCVRNVCFNLNSLSESQLLTDFRFKLPEIRRIADALQWGGVTRRNSYVCDPTLACAVMLYRLATPHRWYDSELKFGMFSSHLSEIFWEMVELLVEKCGEKLELRGAILLMRAQRYADAIRNAGAPYDDCVGFIYCTKIRMQRPGGNGTNQRVVYSGHKRFHCLSYQSLSTPDGLIFALYGPAAGRRHDLTLLRASGWETVLQGSLTTADRQYYIYGDSAYMMRPWMMRPFLGNVTGEQANVNAAMSALRVSVEHSYKDLKQMWVSQDFARNLKVRQAPIALLYKASTLLWNFRTCAYKGGQTIERFQVEPPSLEEYITT